ncbi:MAG: Ldh family oxidoreductase [Candidatus Velthaea sp.]
MVVEFGTLFHSMELNRDLLVQATRLREQVLGVLAAWGMPEDLRATTADVMVDTDLSGIDSHGISMLIMYDEMRAAGTIAFDARPAIVRQNSVTALIDAGAGLGHPASVMAMDLAIDKALANGVGAVSVTNSHHFGAAGYYARMAAARGAIGMVTTASRVVSVVPTRAAVPVMGTNPIAFAAPAAHNEPFVLDMATSTVAANKVRVYALRGDPLPAGWVLDARGEPICDAREAFDTIFERDAGGLTPVGATAELGSHKGYGLSVMAHILGGTLAGGSFSPLRVKNQKPGDPDNIGHFFLALDPAAFGDAGRFADDLDDVIDVLHAAPPIDAQRPVLVAGDPESRMRRERLERGVPLSSALADKLRRVCERSDTLYILDARA